MLKDPFHYLPKLAVSWLIAFALCYTFKLYLSSSVFNLCLVLLRLAGGWLIWVLLISLIAQSGRLLRLTLLLMTLLMVSLLNFYGDRISVLTYFLWHKSQYEAIVAGINTQPTCLTNYANLTGWRIECDPQRQVAFLLPEARPYSWRGIVYSPAGEWIGIPPKRKFGSYLISSERLYGSWHLCTFTS